MSVHDFRVPKTNINFRIFFSIFSKEFFFKNVEGSNFFLKNIWRVLSSIQDSSRSENSISSNIAGIYHQYINEKRGATQIISKIIASISLKATKIMSQIKKFSKKISKNFFFSKSAKNRFVTIFEQFGDNIFF